MGRKGGDCVEKQLGGGGLYLQFRRPRGGEVISPPTKSDGGGGGGGVKYFQILPDVINVWSLTM